MSVSLPAIVGLITEFKWMEQYCPTDMRDHNHPIHPSECLLVWVPICTWASERGHCSFVLPGALERTLIWGGFCTGVSVPFFSSGTLPEHVFWVFRLYPQVGISLAEVLERRKQGEDWVYSWPPGVLYEANQHLQMKIKDQANSPASDNGKAGLILMKSATYIYINHNDSCLLSM